MIRTVTATTLLALSALAGCAAQQAQNGAIEQYPSMKQQIETLYNVNATEEDWFCPEVDIASIDKSQVVSETPTQVKVAVTYNFEPSAGEPHGLGDHCRGFGTRYFTFDKGAGGQLSLVSMSGAQRSGS